MPKNYTDQLLQTITLESKPQRIVSLVPSQTEYLYAIGAGPQIVGVTKFCVHPDKLRKEKTVIGGTKNYDVAKIRDLQPDLIIGNKEENVRQSIEELRNDFPVWMSEIKTLEDAMEMMNALGVITGHEAEANKITTNISNGFQNLKPLPPKKTLYLIWKDPYMATGSDTFIHHMLTRIGLKNCTGHLMRYPGFSDVEIRDLRPELILLPSEPYPFKEEHREELGHLCPQAKIKLVDGEYFSWYGSRLQDAPAYFSNLLL
jgi:ABC-type Fe3+-hydroxamate transport system substrate-binding protein